MRYRLVLPNLASFRSRGKLGERWSLARELGCGVVELPADLVKSAKEAERTGLPIGEALPPGVVAALYGPPTPECPVVLHTDPGIPRRGEGGGLVFPRLRWGDRSWTGRYAESVAAMATTVGGDLEAVEMHPGNDAEDVEEVASGMADMGDLLGSALGRRPTVLLENKHRQTVARVEEMVELVDLLPRDGRHGLVVDLPNLWKAHRSRTLEALEALPWEHVRAVHLHWGHRAPRPEDPLAWGPVFALLRDRAGGLMINPEVFHLAELREALSLIRREIGGPWPGAS